MKQKVDCSVSTKGDAIHLVWPGFYLIIDSEYITDHSLFFKAAGQGGVFGREAFANLAARLSPATTQDSEQAA